MSFFRLSGCAATILALCVALPATTQSQSFSAQESDPNVMGWWQGFPPPEDKIITQPDSIYFSFPRLRWSVCHLREFLPTEEISRGLGMATGEGLAKYRAEASKRIVEACMAQPYFVAGEGRACTKLMQAAPGMVFAKTGAEGVYCAALPREGLGIALKCDDGAGRAAEVMAAMVLASFMPAGDERSAVLDLASRPLKNWNGIEIGSIRTTEALAVK